MTCAREAQSAPRCPSKVITRELRATLLTDDAVSIEALYEPSPASGAEPSDHLALVVGHGFTGALERPALRRVASAFAQRTAVITFSFRGHGRSGGRSTVGDREVLDLAAAVRWARRLGHRRVATVGFSMGGSVVIRQAALYGKNDEIEPVHVAHDGERTGRSPGRTAPAAGAMKGRAPGTPGEAADGAAPDAVIAVSAPARWYYRGTAPMRRVHWAVTRPAGRLVSRYGLRTRIDPRGWDVDPLSPVAAAPLIAPTPLLIVHGDRDPYFPLDHPRMLASAADPSASELWIEPGFGHAETAASPVLLTRIADWAAAHA
ncbi:alpha/beta hydrolase [Streptomyces melanosporofaciens]|uniref:Alpha/beta hydrolase family protein n=1 Tax=Streptomyces melanosporofaciens TaxID=67327 RepID=A0A1H4RUC3_STRMJ|nr:alpha/beta fold hydrolase [Streptomyces melanosporofaciens]SEC35466.1 Alpha/beta hydrolase family protein [Streptomyces melanosporofaciens]